MMPSNNLNDFEDRPVDEATRRRLQWRCRRGLLELDIVFERFLRDHLAVLTSYDVGILYELLDVPDNDLWDMVTGKLSCSDPRHESMVGRLRAC